MKTLQKNSKKCEELRRKQATYKKNHGKNLQRNSKQKNEEN